ncbi:MAG: hypothetical protein WEB00_00090 [Dehalococcoidia bacterium]
MAKLLQVRGMKDKVHAELARRARKKGQSMSQYANQILERELKQIDLDEFLDQLETREPVEFEGSAADQIREERERYLDEVWEENSKSQSSTPPLSQTPVGQSARQPQGGTSVTNEPGER